MTTHHDHFEILEIQPDWRSARRDAMNRNAWKMEQARREAARLRRVRDHEPADLSWLGTLVGFCVCIAIGYLVATWKEEHADFVSAQVVAERDAAVRAKLNAHAEVQP